MTSISPIGDFLVLDTILFGDWSTPSKIDFGMGQMLGVQKLIGGNRTIDAMGADPTSIKWEGRWRGPGAAAGNDAVTALAAGGQQVSLTWGQYYFDVVVKMYESHYEDYFEILYSIELEVIPDGSDSPGPTTSLDSIVGPDMAAAVSAAGSFV